MLALFHAIQSTESKNSIDELIWFHKETACCSGSNYIKQNPVYLPRGRDSQELRANYFKGIDFLVRDKNWLNILKLKIIKDLLVVNLNQLILTTNCLSYISIILLIQL